MLVSEEKLHDLLFQTAAAVFADLAFLLPEESATAQERDDLFSKAASVSFFGPASGRLTLALYGSVLAEMTANMLGTNEQPDEKMQEDALCEVANVICGNLMPLVMGSKRVIQLHAPQIVEREELESELMSTSAATNIAFETGSARIQYYLTRDIS